MSQEVIEKQGDEILKSRMYISADLFYVVACAALYIYSILNPIIGVVIAIVLMTAGYHEKTKKIGRICLILAIIGVVVWALLLCAWLTVGAGFLARFQHLRY